MRAALAALCLACSAPTGPTFVQKPELDAQLAALESRLLDHLRDEDVDGCTRALRLSKLQGGVIYVDSYGHCTFVRRLPQRRGRR